MYNFVGRNVGEISTQVLRHLMKYGQREESRNGPVLVYPEPVMTELQFPYNFLYDDRHREANPFFHIIEFFHMICGRDDLDSLAFFNSGMRQYSDDGKTIMGSAYGRRWRSYFGQDQILYAVKEFSKNPDSRRVVISHWDSGEDLGRNSKDIPCNTEILLRCLPMKDGSRRFNITVINRSNDLVYGTFGANVVHFSLFHHYVAALLNMMPGSYWQFSNNSHLYLENERSKDVMDHIGQGGGLQTAYHVEATEGFTYFDELLMGMDLDQRLNFDGYLTVLCNDLFDCVAGDYRLPDEFTEPPAVSKVATDLLVPLIRSYRYYKNKRPEAALDQASQIAVPIFREVCVNWLKRRAAK